MPLEPAVFPRRPRPPGYGVHAHAYPGAGPGAWGAARTRLEDFADGRGTLAAVAGARMARAGDRVRAHPCSR